MPTATERDDAPGALRRAILEAALPHVPFDGWSQATLEAGARDAGLGEGEALRAFPGGPVEAIAFWSTDADRAMVAALEAMDLGAMRTRDRIAAAIRQRLAARLPAALASAWRANASSVARYSSPQRDSVRWAMAVTDWVCSGCTAQSRVPNQAAESASTPTREARVGARNVRRSSAKRTSVAPRWMPMFVAR